MEEKMIDKVKELSKEQVELLKKFEEIDKEKMKLVTNNGNKEIGERLNKAIEESVKLYTSYDYNEKFEKLYKGFCSKIFTRRIITELKFPEDMKDSHFYSYRSPRGKKISWNKNGMGYLYKPWTYSNERIDSFYDMTNIIYILNTFKDIARNPPIKKEEKLQLYQKFFDLFIQYRHIKPVDKLEIKFDDTPVPTSHKDKQFGSLVTPYQNIEIRMAHKITLHTSNAWDRQFRVFFNPAGEELFSLDRDSNVQYRKAVCGYLPEEVCTKIESEAKKLKDNIDFNVALYDKIVEEFGYIFLAGMI